MNDYNFIFLLSDKHNLLFSVSKIKQETGVAIRIPSDGENSNIIRIEGEPQGVKMAKEQLLEMANRMVGYFFIKSSIQHLYLTKK